MHDHLYMVAASKNLAKEIKNFKSFTARNIIDTLCEKNNQGLLKQLADAKARFKNDSQFQVWQEGSHFQEFLDEAMMRQKVEYIHTNPVRRGLVDDPGKWVYSSYAIYVGHAGLLDVETRW